MKFLLDTHVAIWAITEPKRLDASTKALLEDKSNDVYYSVVSVWEVAIKHGIHPDQMPLSEGEYVSLCEATGFTRMNILLPHIYMVKTLSRPQNAPQHSDPFDRLLLSQAKVEGIQFLTHDHLITDYNEPCIMKI